ncbi:MAG: hypothetical protein ACTSQZ_01525 [Candidatus Thorarchaeota archaeon]
MDVKSYKVCNPKAIMKLNIYERLLEALVATDAILRYVEGLKPKIVDDYISKLEKRLGHELKDYSIHIEIPSENLAKLIHLNQYPELLKLVVNYVSKELGLNSEHPPESDGIEVHSLNHVKALERLSYHTAKSFADLLGDEEAIPFWKQIVAKKLEEQRVDYEKRELEREERGDSIPTMSEGREGAIKRWTEMGLADFTVAMLDDNNVLYRFDKCLTHEALKDLDDRDWAYLCSCYTGDAPEYNSFGRQYMRRTQTLHHGNFCDELYWMKDIHTDPKQPTLEFTENLGKE